MSAAERPVALELDPAALAVVPGDGGGCDVLIGNTGSADAEVHLELVGPARSWSLVSPDHLTIPAGGEGRARLVVRPPRSPGLAPGPVPFTVRAGFASATASPTEASGVIEVGGYAELEARLTPRYASGRVSSDHRLEVDNRGNEVAAVSVEAEAAGAAAVAVGIDPAAIELPPGATATVALKARAGGLHLGWRPRRRRFEVRVHTGGREALRLPATMVQTPVRWPLPAAALAVVAGLAGLVLAVGGGPSTVTASGGNPLTEAPAIPPPAFAVGTRTEVFVDESRPTRAHGSQGAEATRTLRTLVLYPATGPPGDVSEGAPPAAEDGPFPLIVFAHGSGGLGERYFPLLRAWAGAGYVVAAPTFPFASNPDETSADDYANQPADMSFVTTNLLAYNGDTGGGLAGLVDPDRMAAAGHSLGGMTTLGLVANTCCYDPRFDAGVILAGREVPFPHGEFFAGIDTPLLVAHGDADASVRYTDGRLVYIDAPPPKFLVTLVGGDHGEPFSGSPSLPHAQVVTVATLAFFDHQLKDAPDGLERIRGQAQVVGVSRLEEES